MSILGLRSISAMKELPRTIKNNIFDSKLNSHSHYGSSFHLVF